MSDSLENLIGELSDRELAIKLVKSLEESGIKSYQEYYEYRAAYRIFVREGNNIEKAKEIYQRVTGLST